MALKRFENDVKTYGTETAKPPNWLKIMFENDVKTYGTETSGDGLWLLPGLRMM